ncbi:class I SAM-dependent methyltransferase [Nodosilinea sp. PGN35]|uniref:class I SAM-dependent methyltransferase n=1 Tax=Nodosilinea sp. PGN35 TaxID=3020489 RepID=UPI0023B27E31|nr:class I SAM-dependent methyltransferase [Nodosilinea sp. TSF1-S3]MDF0367019.1 class I SAM-dependent methyltransferase [Nodosilinea sp. TSF1-S3]
MTTAAAPPLTQCRCPICDGRARSRFAKYGYAIQGCDRCGHRFVDPASLGQPGTQHLHQVYGDAYFQGGGAGYRDYVAEAGLLRQHGRRYARLLRRYTSPGRVLDVGAAAGFVLQGLIDGGWQGQGIEPNPTMAEYGRRHLGLPIATGALEDVNPDQQFDLITMVQVVPHFYDLRRALTSATALTAPGGYWLIETWNRRSWTARLLGSHWHEYSPPSVLHWFSPQDLTALVRQYGFVPVAQGRPQKWINAAHGKSLLDYKLRDLGGLGRGLRRLLPLIPDGLSLPYPGDDLFWLLVQRKVNGAR